MFFRQTPIFSTAGRSHYRIPSMISTKKGTVLAFCNDRKDSIRDAAAECDLVLCRKEKGGQWSKIQCLQHIPGWTHLIGTAIYDEITDTAMCSFKRIAIRTEEFGNYTDEERRQIAEKEKQLAEEAGVELGQRLLVSSDDGKTWVEKPLTLTPVVLKDPQGHEKAFEGYSHGAGAGIQLRHGKYAGRLICPAKVRTGHCSGFSELKSCMYNLAFFSDDHGKTWHSSQPVQIGTGEGTLIEREDGSILYNSRAYFGDQKRYLAVSTDGGASYGEFTTDAFLVEEKRIGCNASMLRIERSSLPEDQRKWLPEQASAITLFSNPRAEERRNMTLCVSFNDGESWAHTKCVWEGPSGYSSLAYTACDGHFYLLYELGKEKYTDQGLAVAEFDLEWLFTDK